MPIKFGTTAEQRRAKELLATQHRIDIIVELMDLSHNHSGDISKTLLSGQVNIDTTADTATRSATLELLDPTFKLKLDDDAPNDGSLYFTRMVKITYSIATPDRSERYFIPIFCGPITKVDRTGAIVDVEAMGKEILASDNVWRGKTYKKRLKKTDVIEAIMRAAGEAESKMQFVHRKTLMGHNVSSTRKVTFWSLARKIAGSMRLQLFYDGRGVLILRRRPSRTVHTFNGQTMVSEAQIGYDNDEDYNAVLIIGGKPKGAKKKLTYRHVAPKTSALSPDNLGRNGTKRYIPLIIEDDSIKSRKAAKARAKRELAEALRQDIEVTFDALPMPFLEEDDLCNFRTQTAAGSFRLQKMTIPLTADGDSSIGYLRRVSPKRARNPGGGKRRAGQGKRKRAAMEGRS